jgi:preprotein translocase subunit SecF
MEETRKNWYDKNYKKILIIPLAVLLFSIAYLFYFNIQNGDIILKDVSITGGTTITVFDKNVNVNELETALSTQFSDINTRTISEFRSGEQKGFFVETQSDATELKKALENYLGYPLTQENSSTEFSGSSLSQGFYHQLRFAILLAFLFMAIVVFIIFRSFIPSLAVILSAFADIVMTLAVVDFLGMSLSIAGVIAFLMLIGYSVDTDILLTSRLIKGREGTVNERLKESFKTGITMTLTSIAAISVSLIIIYSVSEVLRQIFTILLIGLAFDIFNTWFANAGILKWYVESKHGGSQ